VAAKIRNTGNRLGRRFQAAARQKLVSAADGTVGSRLLLCKHVSTAMNPQATSLLEAVTKERLVNIKHSENI
jgi:hypothetical protein